MYVCLCMSGYDACVLVCMCVCMCVMCVHVYVCMYICMYVCMYVFMCVCVHICMCVVGLSGCVHYIYVYMCVCVCVCMLVCVCCPPRGGRGPPRSSSNAQGNRGPLGRRWLTEVLEECAGPQTVFMSVCLLAWLHVCSMYVCKHVCMSVCV